VRAVNLPTDVLRTLVTIVDLGSFTKAGDKLGRTQPAISLQIRKLEDAVGHRVFDTSGRSCQLTPDGEILVRYARQLLCLNDEAVARLQRRPATGRLRIGLPVDYAVDFFQRVLTNFLEEHRDVEIEIACDVSSSILKMLSNDDLDIAIAMSEGPSSPALAFSWAERPIWVAASGSDVRLRSPVPIAAHNEGCPYRARMIDTLDRIGKPWRIAFTSPGINGLQNAVLAGFGVSALTSRTLLGGMHVLTQDEGFPPLPDVHLGLHYKHSLASTAGMMLASYLTKSLHDSGQTGLVRIDRGIAARATNQRGS